MDFKINGVNIMPYIALNGLKWTRADVDSGDAGRTMDGTLHRDRVAIKRRVDVTLRPLKDDEILTIMNLIKPEYVTVESFSPYDGPITLTMYSNNIPVSIYNVGRDGKGLWIDISFPLVER